MIKIEKEQHDALGLALCEKRLALGTTVYRLSQQTGISEEQIRKLERGACSCTTRTLMVWMRALGIDLIGLVNGAGLEKRAVGRPSTKSVHQVPPIDWGYYEIGDKPEWDSLFPAGFGLNGYHAAVEEGAWAVTYFVDRVSFQWIVINVSQRWHFTQHGGRAPSLEDAQKQLHLFRIDFKV